MMLKRYVYFAQTVVLLHQNEVATSFLSSITYITPEVHKKCPSSIDHSSKALKDFFG